MLTCVVHQYSEICGLVSCCPFCRNPACLCALSVSVFSRIISSTSAYGSRPVLVSHATRSALVQAGPGLYNHAYHTPVYPFNGPLSGTTRVSRYQKGKTNLDFTEARDSEWQWHQRAICKSAPRSRQITMPAPHCSVFLQAGCPSCRPTNSVKALKARLPLNINALRINCLARQLCEHSYST